jgi:nucleotidyltransferase/DNA polymerase involved in DNA repair/energy-coupling factor transporter ATP-binding protein EcfA2
MRLVSLDIDPQDRSNRIHLGPFVAGLNAVWGNRGSGKSTIAKFIRGLLYHRHRDATGYGQDAVDGLVGSMQWADTAGATRVISSADAVHERDYRFEGPYYHARRQSNLSDAAYPNAIPLEQPWQRIGGEIFDAVLCGRLGEVLPERLWQAARELGIHVSTGNENDETLRRLKAEEHRLHERLHHLRVDDRDREWWAAERERLASRLADVVANPNLHAIPASNSVGHSSSYDSQSPSASQLREWESQRIQYQAEKSELISREADLVRRLSTKTPRPVASSTFIEHEDAAPPSHGRYGRTTTVYRDPFGTWTGYAKPVRETRDFGWKSTLRDNPVSHDQSDSELSSVRHRLAQVNLLIADLDSKIHERRVVSVHATSAWESQELRARLGYAEEVLKSWDLYEQTRLRLAEVQNQLRGFGPYHEAFRGSFVQCVERYVRELSAGALRQLPTWAMEAMRRDLGYAAGLSTDKGRIESYREVYRDYRPDTNKMDFPVPPSQSSERQLVELAIRMAILDSAAHRIGRLPLILDDALDGFHGPTLDHVVRVLIEFARDGQQVLLMTSEQEVAERVRVHHGWVSHLKTGAIESNQNLVRPRLYSEPRYEAGNYSRIHPLAFDEYSPTLADLNAQLASVDSNPFDTVAFVPAYQEPRTHAVPTTEDAGKFHLTERHPIEDAPGMRSELGQRVRRLGFHSVGQWISADPQHLAHRLGNFVSSVELIARRQAEARLMCGVPQLRAFDARVLAGCGFTHPQSLAAMHPGRLLRRVETFLTTPEGQEIMRTATSYELSRITNWIASARSSHTSRNDDTYRSARRQEKLARRARRDSERSRTERVRPPQNRSEQNRSEREIRTVRVPSPTERQSTSTSTRRSHANSGGDRRSPSTLRFYLDPSSPVVDAPSIGPRMEESFRGLGIVYVQDLLQAEPHQLAEQLADKRVTGETIVEWQNQARLVCRIPNLRGHDAQMLVACGITAPEQLLQINADELHTKVASFASSKAGQRVLRGTSGADLAEIQEWIAWARQSRTLLAA